MKFFMFLAIAALVVGGIYHTELSDYFASFSNSGGSYGGGSSVLGAMQDMGNASNNLLGGASDALNR